MADMNQDRVGWLKANTPAPEAETQLDRIERMLTQLAKSPSVFDLASAVMAGPSRLKLWNRNCRATPAVHLSPKKEQYMHQVKSLHLVTREEVRLMANAAAERSELLDAANVFAAHTPNHALFAREYLAHAKALEEVA